MIISITGQTVLMNVAVGLVMQIVIRLPAVCVNQDGLVPCVTRTLMNVVRQPVHVLKATQSVRTYSVPLNATVKAGTRKMPRTNVSVSTVN